MDTRTRVLKDVPHPGSPGSRDLAVLEKGVSEFTLKDDDSDDEGGPLTPGDIHALRSLRDDMRAICERGKQRNVKIIIDAEYTWMQVSIFVRSY